LIYNTNKKKDIPIVKQPSKLITLQVTGFSKQTAVFKLLLEESHSEIAKMKT
jgi:hypothetical protein